MTAAPAEPYYGASGMQDRWTDILRADTLVHLCLLGAIAGGCFQGWLKDRFAGPLPYALSDGLFMLAFLLWFASIVVFRRPMFVTPRASKTDVMLVFIIALPFLYVPIFPAPLAVIFAGLRAWVAFPVAALIGLSITKSAGQVRAYIGLILVLCVITAVYGIIQYRAGPDVALGTGLGQMRHGVTLIYLTQSGQQAFRAFSTFTFPAPFAAWMVSGILMAAGIVASRRYPTHWRIAALALTPLFFVAMTLSGTRAALLTLLLGLLVIGWLRGSAGPQLVLVALLLFAMHLAVVLSAGSVLDRFTSIVLQEGLLWRYLTLPIQTGFASLQQHLFGVGLGRTGVGVPLAVTVSMGPRYFVFADGDTGRAAVEMGLLGLSWLGVVVFGLLPRAYRAVRAIAATPDSDLAFGIGALVLSTGAVILIGSPLSTTPHALVWWFLFGAIIKLAQLRAEAEADVASRSTD